MASVFPFKALHPYPNEVKQISCPPYDVIDTEEARELAADNAQSFLHIIRPEIDLPAGTVFNDDRVYKQGAENLQHFIDDNLLIQEKEPALYLYQLVWQENTQTGIFGCVSVDEYDDEVILKHELTRPDKEDDRTRHILEQQAHAEPVMLTYKDQPELQALTDEIVNTNRPMYDFEAPDGVKHKLWKVPSAKRISNLFAEIDHLYIADGHHRCKSASRAAHYLRKEQPNGPGSEAFNYFPAVIFPMSQMNILAYNRLVHTLPDDFTDRLYKQFNIRKMVNAPPDQKGEISLYLNGKRIGLSLPEIDNASAVKKLDAYRLQKFLLEPLLNIGDPRRDENISFVGGIHGTQELENRVDAGSAALAISMYPTAIEELIEISDEHQLMPPKSTWFEPKLRSGLLVHKF